GSNRCACSASSSRCSGPTMRERNWSKLSVGSAPGSAPDPLIPGPRSTPRAATESAIPGVLGTRQPEVVGEPHRHFGEERRNRGPIRLVGAQLPRLTRQRRQDIVDLLTDVLAQTLLLIQHLCCRRSLWLFESCSSSDVARRSSDFAV